MRIDDNLIDRFEMDYEKKTSHIEIVIFKHMRFACYHKQTKIKLMPLLKTALKRDVQHQFWTERDNVRKYFR